LNFLLFKPALRLLDKRKTATVGVKEEIARLGFQTEERLKQHEEKIAQAKSQGSLLKEKIRKEGETEAAKILGQAKSAADQHLTEMQKKLAQEQSEARLQLRKTVEDLGKGMAERILDKKVG
jgi:F0F1-type ATP synthase membrane subunit b/b'